MIELHSSLSGSLVALEPLEGRHIPALVGIAKGSPEAFVFTNTPITDDDARVYFDEAFRMRADRTGLPYAVCQASSRKVIGTTRVYEIDPSNRRCSLGFTWFSPEHHGDGSNTESKFLLLDLAFERLRVNRVQFQVDARNTKSTKALVRLGAQEEGRLRSHRLAKDGSFRTSVIFSIISEEWPKVKSDLTLRLKKYRG